MFCGIVSRLTYHTTYRTVVVTLALSLMADGWPYNVVKLSIVSH